MDNPDGVTISQYGFSAIRNKKLRKKCEKIGHAETWKANARGVNLNNNFPAGFKKGKAKKAHYMNYYGKKAGSEKETKALMKFINEINPNAVLNIHSTGSIIYWDFDVEQKLHDKLQEMAEKIHSYNKYMLMPRDDSTEAGGGFADWIVYKKKIPSVTVETGNEACPLPHSEYKSIYKKNHDMFMWFMTEFYRPVQKGEQS
jgi:g-D-glutamyl-meso-diaminopimelate peptidase